MSEQPGTARDFGLLSVGGGIVALSLVLAWQASLIASEGVGSTVGPNVAPWFVAIALGLLGLALVLQSAFGWSGPAEEGDDLGPIDRRGAGWTILGLVLNVTLIEHAGFIIASTLMFVCIARAFGSERALRDASIGFLLAFIAYLGFDRLLGYKIGTGLIERLI